MFVFTSPSDEAAQAWAGAQEAGVVLSVGPDVQVVAVGSPPRPHRAASAAPRRALSQVASAGAYLPCARAVPFGGNLDVIDGTTDGEFGPPACPSAPTSLFVLDTGVSAVPGLAARLSPTIGACYITTDDTTCASASPPWADSNGHGTWCAGIAAGDGVGVFPSSNTTIYAVKGALGCTAHGFWQSALC